MSARHEFDRLLRRAGVTPFRRVGKVRVAHDPGTPGDTLKAAIEAVKRFAPAHAETWPDATAEQLAEWKRQGLVVLSVCDEPCPRGLDPEACPVEILIDRCERYHFRLSVDRSGGLAFSALPGWTMAAVTPLLPAWFVEACRARRPEIVEALAAGVQA